MDFIRKSGKKRVAPALAVCALLAMGTPSISATLGDYVVVDGNTININFSSADESYTLSETDNLETSGHTINVNGVVEGENRSTLDLNCMKGFNPNNGSLNISNLKIINGSTFRGGAVEQINNYYPTEINNVIFQWNSASEEGGAIYNENSLITKIAGSFIGNLVQNNSYAQGGAIFNSIEIPRGLGPSQTGILEIEADFIGNSAEGKFPLGGAIYNSDYIGSIKGNFEYNSAKPAPVAGSLAETRGLASPAEGGAIYNRGTIGSIEADFTGNYAESLYGALGGAISNYYGHIGTIEGDFVQNFALSDYEAYGGAISTTGNIEKITGSFVENYVQAGELAEGGAIYNATQYVDASLDETLTNGFLDIEADFTGNYAVSQECAYGGAIANEGEITSIKGDFTGNYAIYSLPEEPIMLLDSNPLIAGGGAIFNDGEIDKIESNFLNNYVSASEAIGGAINNSAYIESITGNFTGNYAQGHMAAGGAICNDFWGYIGSISADFVNNHVIGSEVAIGGAVANFTNPAMISSSYSTPYYEYIISDENGNEVFKCYGFNRGDSSEQYKEILKDGANIYPNKYDTYSRSLDDLYSEYNVDNFEDLKVALEKEGLFFTSPEDIYQEFNQLDNQSSIVTVARTTDALTFRNSSFINNYAELTEATGMANGGAIYSYGNIRMIADDGNKTLISGNYVKTPNGIIDNAISMADRSVLVLDSRNNSTLQIDDKIEFETPVTGSAQPLQAVQENDTSFFF